MDKILKIATKELGIREYPGPDHNPRIIKYAEEAGMDWVNDDETPWCSIFLNWVCEKAHFERSHAAAARSWLNIGSHTDLPEPGHIVVYWRISPTSWQGHVGIFLGYSKNRKRIYTLGGNQQNAVSISAYNSDQLLGFRVLKSTIDLQLSTETLNLGDRGPAVVKLQDALKMGGFDCGTSDGFFGPMTEKAVKKLQRASGGDLEIDGIFGRDSRLFLIDLVQNG